MSSRKVKVIIGVLAVAVLVMFAAAHSRKSNYSIVIPKVLTYPTTTLTFASTPRFLALLRFQPIEFKLSSTIRIGQQPLRKSIW
jgi:hypothetical protein